MAFNSQTFRKRTITSVVFVVVMLAGLLWNQWSFFVLFSIIHFGCWIEYQKLIGLIDKDYQQITPFHKYGVMIAGWCIMLYFTNDSYNIFGLRLHELGWWMGLLFIFILPVTELLFTRNIQLKNIGYSTLGVLYISLSWGLMMDLYGSAVHDSHTNIDINTGIYITTGLVYIIWINDTMAYLVGSFIGKTPFSKISPKKTWEGTLGGIILCAVLIGIFERFPGIFSILPYAHYKPNYKIDGTWDSWVIIAMVATIASTFGDLLESKLKRMANVKDSGTLMPGHGGFLDRFDSLLLATPFVWLYIQLFIG